MVRMIQTKYEKKKRYRYWTTNQKRNNYWNRKEYKITTRFFFRHWDPKQHTNYHGPNSKPTRKKINKPTKLNNRKNLPKIHGYKSQEF